MMTHNIELCHFLMTFSDHGSSFQHPGSASEQLCQTMLHVLPTKPFKVIGSYAELEFVLS